MEDDQVTDGAQTTDGTGEAQTYETLDQLLDAFPDFKTEYGARLQKEGDRRANEASETARKKTEAKYAQKQKPEPAKEEQDLDALIEKAFQAKIEAFEKKQAEKELLKAKAKKFNIDLSELEGKSALEIMELFDSKLPDIVKNANAGADVNPPKGKKDKKEPLTEDEKRAAQLGGMSEDEYRKMKEERQPAVVASQPTDT